MIGSISDHPGRRRAERYPLNADVEVLEPISAHGVVINASSGGLRVALDKELKVGSVCVLALQVGEKQTTEFARVAWVREYPDGYLVGFSYVDEV